MFPNGNGVMIMDHIRIGNVLIEKTAVLAPMASVADRAYRVLNREFGAAMTVSEMISAKGLCYNDRKTEELCRIVSEERPCALQLFGSEPEFIAKAVDICMRFEPDIFDINMGCPVPKVAGNGSGSALMKDIPLAAEIVSAAKERAKGIPVTVKIRKGWDENSVNAVEFAKAMETAGADAIAIHGRTKNQMYSGKADWEIIKAVKAAVSVPVIGNGDVACLKDCLEMYEQTGCDLVMIGRASYGNPWIFKEINSYFHGESFTPPTLDEQMEIMLYHLRLILKSKPENVGMREARKHAAWYMKSLYGAAGFRARCYSLESYDDAVRLANEFLELQSKK